MTGQILKSIDSLVFEIIEEDGVEYVSVRRCDKNKLFPGMDFLKGDKIAGARVLNQIGELIGYGPVAEIEGENEK